jgi:cytochrome c biogenesis protein
VATACSRATAWVAAERGYLREAGNLLFHLAVVVVLVGFAVGGLFGYKGGVILVVGNGFSNNLTQYDDFDPGSLFDPGSMEPFSFRGRRLRRRVDRLGAAPGAWRRASTRTSPTARRRATSRTSTT